MKKLTSIFLVLAMLLTLTPMNIFAADANKTDFSDVKASDYYAQAAAALGQLDILSGYPDGTFGADKPITRAEMAAVVCRMIDKESDAEKAKGKTAFDDVEDGHWAAGYINVASKEGIINGDGNGKFRPEDEVKHEEAIKMVVCALGYGDDVEVDEKDWSKGYLELADKKGIATSLKGTKGEATTRGDVAVMSYNGLTADAETSKIPVAPTASKKAGEYKGTQKVKLTTVTKGAEIYYTTNGKTPTAKSTKYTKEISISKTCTLKAVAIKNGVVSKDVLSVDYKIKNVSTGVTASSNPLGASACTVSFDLNYTGATGAPAAQSVTSGSVATEPAAPVRDGYVFGGWTLDAVNNNVFDFSTVINANVILYAIWTEGYLVSFDSNYADATGAPAAQIISSGNVATEPTAPVRDGYNFAGWFTDAECLTAFDFTSNITATTVLYAKWEAAPVTIELTASQTSLFTSVDDEYVTFYATIVNNDGSFTSVTLYDGENNVVSSLYDNGQYSTNGDEFSNDDIYTCIVGIDVDVAAILTYKVVAEGSSTVTSNNKQITITESMTQAQIANMNQVDNSIQSDLFMTNGFTEMTLEDRADLADDLLDDLIDDGLVMNDSVIYNSESGSYTFMYESGALGSILLKDWNEDQNGNSTRTEVATRQEELPAASMSLNSQNSIQLMSSNTTEQVDADAIILWSFDQAWDDPSYRRPFYNTVESSWESAGVDTTVVWNSTVEDYKNLKDYEIIVFSGHGDFDKYTYNTSQKSLSSLLLHEFSTPQKDEKYKNELKLFNIGKTSILGGTVYAILPDFWTSNYKPGDLEGSFVFAENCEFYGEYGTENYKMAEALLSVSAESVIGFHNSVMATYCRNLMKLYVDKLIEGSTSGEAFEYAKGVYGNTDYFTGRESYGPTAYPLLRGDSGARLKGTDFKNGSFEESVALSGWMRKGDVRVLTKLGGLEPTHKNKMAILTTGIGSGTSDYLEATEGSVLYQTFKVPQDITSIKFSYNVVSEEPMEYVGTEYDDKFFAELVSVSDSTTVKLAEESVNEAVWYSISNIDFDGGDHTTYNTGWKTVTYDLSAYQGKLVTIRFVVYDVGDSIYDTATLIDNVVIQ